jgi:hypothetical protein
VAVCVWAVTLTAVPHGTVFVNVVEENGPSSKLSFASLAVGEATTWSVHVSE